MEPYKRPRILTEISNGHRALLHGGIGKVHGGLIFLKVTMQMKPSTDRTERARLS